MKRAFRLSDSGPDSDRDVGDEIRFYLDMRTAELMEQGMSPEDARRAARAAFGDVSAVEAECRTVRAGRTRVRERHARWRGAAMDALFALRTLRHNAGFTLTAVLTLALGIGAAAAVFTVVSGVLLRPLPYASPNRLAMIWLAGKDVGAESDQLPLSAAFYDDVSHQTRTFSALAAFRSNPYTLGDVDTPEQLAGARITPSLFSLLGVRPVLGRTFRPDEAVVGGPYVAVISDALWRGRFGASPSIIGRQITLSGNRFTVIGVMPRGFAFPRGAELPSGLQFGNHTDVWTPLVFSASDLANRDLLNLAGIGRLRPGVTLAQAQRDLDGIMRRVRPSLSADLQQAAMRYHAMRLEDQAAAPVRRGLLVLLGAVAFVLLIACANVVNLLIARGAGRRREFAVRAALGAGGARLAAQLVIENVILAIVGAAGGMLLAVWGSRAMVALVPGSLPRADDVTVDWRVVSLTAILAVLAGIAFGLAAAAAAARSNVAETLQSGGTRSTAGGTERARRRLLVAAEIALSLVLLTGAGLLAESFVRLQRVPPGFAPDHALTADVLLPFGGNFDPVHDGPSWARFFDAYTARLAALPGVHAAGAVSSLPLSGAIETSGFRVVGRPTPPPDRAPAADYAVVSGEYFRAMRIPLVSGRAFDARDRSDGAPVAIISRELARRYFPGENPIGQQIKGGFEFTPRDREIVGVVGDVKQSSLEGAPVPAIYVPESQVPYPALTLVVRTTGDPHAALAPARAALAAENPTLALAAPRTLGDVVSNSIARQRFRMIVLGVFAALAIVLALVGLYGVIALSVSQRTRELGVRMAVGARPRDVMSLVLREALRVTALGVAAGLAGAFALTQLLRSFLFGVSATSPLVYAAAAAGIGAVALAAASIPARRAMRVDPVCALRTD